MIDNLYIYDIETYPNVFTAGFERLSDGTYWEFELSPWKNTLTDLMQMLGYLFHTGARMVGFNNEHFDYPVIHMIHHLVASGSTCTAADIYAKAQAIIDAPRNDWSHNVRDIDKIVPQVDLFKIMHFDNFARATSLKKLEIAMRSKSVKDLPFKPGTVLTQDDMPILLEYQKTDVNETGKFCKQIMKRIEFRDQLTAKTGKNFTNFNDTRIGKQTLINALEWAGIACYERVNGRKEPRQTSRWETGIVVSERLLPVPFKTEPLKRMWTFFNEAVIPEDKTKGFFKKLTAPVGNLTAHFGSGGIHASVNNRSYYSTSEWQIVDIDVTSYYPSLAIVNRFYPQHLSDKFCDIYQDLFNQRVSYPKGTPENAMLKLALNGVYGDSNNIHSPFFDPAYTMAITIGGQLLIAWLGEMIAENQSVELIQLNTDGLTVKVHSTHREWLDQVCRYWESHTKLKLESVDYDSMHIRDVNNYIAIWHEKGKRKVKRKNAYLTEPDWHQDHSSLVIPKAVDQFVENGTRPVDFIYSHTDPFDFMRHIKVPRNSELEWGDDLVQNTTRYYISLTGEYLTKIMPPLKGSDRERRIGVDVGWRTQICNDVDDFNWHNLNRRFYVEQADKLVEGLGLKVKY